jgi:hypothetical protein
MNDKDKDKKMKSTYMETKIMQLEREIRERNRIITSFHISQEDNFHRAFPPILFLSVSPYGESYVIFISISI